MVSGRITKSWFGPSWPWATCFRLAALTLVCTIGVLPASSFAKDPHLSAIVLYDDINGPAYAQITGVLMNGKIEMRLCDDAAKIDKKSYGKLAKISLRSAKSLERNASGVLMLKSDSEAVCVVPDALTFEKQAEFTLAEAADHASLQGTVVLQSSRGLTEPPPLKRGVQVVFVAAPDKEMAEYLRAQRAQSIGLWQHFLELASPAHAAEARKALAGLFQQSAEAALADYRKSVASPAPDFAKLKLAQAQAEQAGKQMADYAPTAGLKRQIQAELDALVGADRTELEAYHKALAEHTTGYAHLVAAERQNDVIVGVDSQYPSAVALHNELAAARSEFETAVQKAEALVTSGNYDDAFQAAAKFRSFAAEVPRLKAIGDAVYQFHFNRGQELSKQLNWAGAIEQYRTATEIKTDSNEARAKLKNAETQLMNNQNREAADQARTQSVGYAEQKQYIEAYHALARLPEAQRELVSDQLAALKSDFVTAAFQQALKLQAVHLPIHGRVDEDAVRQAHDLFKEASALSGDQSIKLKLDFLSEKISAYYLDTAKRFLARPLGSGVGLGWLYLSEAHYYKPDLDAVRDERNRFAAIYQLRSRLSMGIEIHDQTSRRESSGFADQLRDAVGDALESMGIKAVRRTADTTGGISPNFLLTAQIVQVRVVNDPKPETLQSQYRFNTREVKNDAWVKATYELEAAKQELSNAEQSLSLAQGRNKKAEIAAATATVAEARKKFEDLRNKRDSIDEYVTQDIVKPYNYTKTTYNETAVIELTFRITDPADNPIEPATQVKTESHKTAVVLENVKPEDTEGVKAQDKPPDEVQFREELEIIARDALVKTVREKVAHLPEKILERARTKAAANDWDGAAEDYILYLNATPDAQTPGRDEATKFLHEHFNVSPKDAA